MINFLGMDHKYSVKDREELIAEISQLKEESYVYLETCNRVELYYGDGEASKETIRHLFRVVSGLESKVLGEMHIQGQIKRSFLNAVENGHVLSGLNKFFQAALNTGKAVRSQTEISKGSITHAHAVYNTVKKYNLEEKTKKIIFIGAHAFNARIIHLLKLLKWTDIYITNRTFNKTFDISDKYDIKNFEYENLKEEIKDADIVISATSSKDIIIDEDLVKLNEKSDLLLIDLAVPHDIDKNVVGTSTTLSVPVSKNVELYDIERIEEFITKNKQVRYSEILNAEKIINNKINIFLERQNKIINGRTYEKN